MHRPNTVRRPWVCVIAPHPCIFLVIRRGPHSALHASANMPQSIFSASDTVPDLDLSDGLTRRRLFLGPRNGMATSFLDGRRSVTV